MVLSYDPMLMKTLETLDLEAPIPTLRPLFEGLKPVPVMVIRGANSDLLSQETVTEMQALHGRLEIVTVPDQGHAPLLEGDLIERIRDFVQAASAL
ncbi:MAG TPA: alpha/beta hydrolase [Microvirga sp.]|nr:alpha/beta hydrolase [Microvirga sp.]